ncbi:MAG: hypothetical protein ACTSUM_01320, partial [Alphaproteobacteria bacterium]
YGKIKKAYLYTDVLVDYKRPLTKHDALYFRIDQKKGNRGRYHIATNKNRLKTPLNKESIYLYDMSNLCQRRKDENIEKCVSQNLLNILNKREKLEIITFISSARKGRVMNEVSIYYECEESTPDCLIEKIK